MTPAPSLQARSLSVLPGIRHGFFTRAGGVSGGVYDSLNGGVGSNDEPARVAENRARMAAALAVAPERLITAYQIHSPNVVVAEKPWTHSDRPRADAIVSKIPGLALGISTADCGPILMADAEARVIGASHAGWRGALAGVHFRHVDDGLVLIGLGFARRLNGIGRHGNGRHLRRCWSLVCRQ